MRSTLVYAYEDQSTDNTPTQTTMNENGAINEMSSLPHLIKTTRLN